MGLLAAKVVYIFGAEVGFGHPVEEPFKPGGDAVARLVGAIVGVAAEEVVELDLAVVQAVAKVDLRHS